jgi:hypothetical protein
MDHARLVARRYVKRAIGTWRHLLPAAASLSFAAITNVERKLIMLGQKFFLEI